MDHTLFRFANVSAVGQLEFEGVAATEALCDDGYALNIAGGDISRFTDGKGALLLQHNPSNIVGTCILRKAGSRVMMRGKFASPGVSETADQARRLLKDGTLNALSLCFSVQKSEPIPGGGKRAIKWTALETSLVAVGMDPGAVVTQRALSQILARSGRRLSAETERCLRAALEKHSAAMTSHRDAMQCQRQLRDMLENVLDRDDSGGMVDESERARRHYALAVRQRRWPPGTLDATAARTRQLRELELLKRRWPPQGGATQRRDALARLGIPS